MRIGLVITVHDRPQYLSRTLESLSQTYLPNDLELFMVNDNSTDPITNKLFSEFNLPNKIVKVVNKKNENMFYGLKMGWDYFFNNKFDILANIDSDVILKFYWLSILSKLLTLFPDRIITGFNTPHHAVSSVCNKYCTKKTIGGINCFFNRHVYPQIVGVLKDAQWDWRMCYKMQEAKKMFIVATPSVVQHIGASSTLRSHDRCDIAEDWIN